MAKRDVPSTSYDLFSDLDLQDDYLEEEEEEEEEEEVVQPLPPKCTHNARTVNYPCNVKLAKKLSSKNESISKSHMYNLQNDYTVMHRK